MGSTRSSSPASDGDSPQRLSPKSKIKALLAQVDSSEDEDAEPRNSPRAALENPQGSPSRSKGKGNSTDEDSQDDSNVEMKPRGRLAARMLAAETTVGKDAEDVDMIIPDDQDDDLPAIPRRLHRKIPSRESTPGTELPPKSNSPGLFMSSPVRPSPTKPTNDESESEDELPPTKSDRFKALVERKRQERLAREAVEEDKNAERRARQDKLASELSHLDCGDDDDDGVSDITDDEGGRRLSQAAARPAQRKAGKKAIEEMNRETQRMQRNMQLAHEAKTRKKISKNALFERFNFRQNGEADSQTTGSDGLNISETDAETRENDVSSNLPAIGQKHNQPDSMELDEDALVNNHAEEPVVDKGKGKDIDASGSVESTIKPKRQFRVKLPPPSARVNLTCLESDDDGLEIRTTTQDKVNAVFDRVPAKKESESHSLQALRALAQLKSPGKEVGRGRKVLGIGAGELQAKLQEKVRQQAKKERDKRLETLKAQGVVVQTAEERERQMQEVEDILAKARAEASEITSKERAEAKKNKDGEEHDPLAWDDSEDEEYVGSADDEEEGEGEDLQIEFSGSEDEEGEAEGEDEGENEGEDRDVRITEDEKDGQDADAGDTVEEVAASLRIQGTVDNAHSDDDSALQTKTSKRRARNQTTILSDDEEEMAIESTPQPKSRATPKAPNTSTSAGFGSVLRSNKKTFIPGLPVQGAAGLGLTQIFAGTMDDSQMTPSKGPTQSILPNFDDFPDSNFSATVDATMEEPDYDIVATQPGAEETQGVRLNFSQSQMRGLDSLLRDDIPSTQGFDMMEPSQDGGFQEHTPLKNRFASQVPQSTVDTILVGQGSTPHDSPLVRRGRLRRKIDTVAEDDEVVPTAIASTEEPANTVFKALEDGARKEKKNEKKRQLDEDFDRKKSKAKEMVEDQAFESDDEYHGLGGADGEDSDDESAASVKDMIDDAAGNDLDDSKLAAFYADRERASDEQAVEKLFKDITSGMLRRKRGADYDLSDSDDDGEARRRMKRRQFAKMQKALFSDERVKKMAEDPGNQAFLKTMEDQGSDDGMDILDIDEEPRPEDNGSQSQRESSHDQKIVPDSQPDQVSTTRNHSTATTRAPAQMRRTKNGRKPANIGEIRETLSDLLDDGREGSIIPATEAGSSSEEEDADDDEDESLPIRNSKENTAPITRDRNAVVDRLTLKRNSSSSSSSASASNSRLAFASASSSSTFKVPALLRRATTNSFKTAGTTTTSSSTGVSTTNSSSSSTTYLGGGESAGGFGSDAKIKKTAGKKSGINAFARENERRAKMVQSERRREEKKVKGAEKRIGVVGGLLGKGSFE